MFFITLACVSSETHNLQRVFRPGMGVLPYMDGLYRYVRRPKGMVFKSFWSEIGYVNWVCFLEEATSSSFGDKTISLLMFKPTLDFRKGAAHPHPTFLEVLPRVFRRILYTNGGSLCQAFLAEIVETGTKNRCLIEATHVLRRKLRKN